MDQRDKQNLAVGVIVVVLLVTGVWLMDTMRRHSLIEDCLMAHRRNCDALTN